MTKQGGMAWTTLSVDNAAGSLTAIKAATTNLDFATPRAVQDITSIDLSAMERLLLLADFSINLSMNFDDAITHPVFRSINTGVTRRTNITVAASNLNVTGVLYTDYTVTRAATGALTTKATGMLCDGSVPTWS
jgi:hypothetical protein